MRPNLPILFIVGSLCLVLGLQWGIWGLLFWGLESFALTFAIVGDGGKWNAASRKVRDSILNSQVQRLILPGDNLYDPRQTYQEVWDPWKRMGLTFDLVALGNHMLSAEEEIDYFGMPGEYYAQSYGENIRFFILNSVHPETAQDQAIWLSDELDALTEETMAFVVFHHPPYTLTRRHRWTEQREFHEAVRPVLYAHRDLLRGIIVGHDHIASIESMDGLPLIVSGATHESLPSPPVDEVQEDRWIQTRWRNTGGYYWVRLDVDPESSSVWYNFINVDLDHVDCSVGFLPGQPWKLRENCLQPSF